MGSMGALARILLACVAAALVGAGGPGLRALHLATDAGHCSGHASEPMDHHGCDHHHAAGGGHAEGHGGDEPSPVDPPDHDRGCATCELLVALATVIQPAPEVPTFLALVAAAEVPAPPGHPAPAAPRALFARPPPRC